MKKLLVLTSALLICGASIASAAAPGCNLTWSNCATTAAAQNYSFTCDDNTLTRNLIASYRLAVGTPDFVGVSATIDYVLGAPGTPDYFAFGAGGCREGAFAPVSVGTLAGCTNAYAGANQAGGFVNEQTGPNRWRIRADWARDAAGTQVANTLYAALVMQMSTNGAIDEGFGACAGCEVPACFVLNSLATFTQSGTGQFDLTNQDFRNWATYQGGGVGGGGCPAETPSKSATWGAVKALYR
jgi:hypothetical protein